MQKKDMLVNFNCPRNAVAQAQKVCRQEDVTLSQVLRWTVLDIARYSTIQIRTKPGERVVRKK